MSDAFHVVLDDASLAASETRVGTLFRERSRGHEVVSFAYEASYLAHAAHVEIDPALSLVAGRLHASPDRMFGVFRDCAPDRWGRVLMDRREAVEAKLENRAPRRLSEFDFLAGVDDTTRHGALRLRTTEDPAAYVDDRDRSVPPFSRLRELQALAARLERGDDAPELERWLSQLVAPGSSLGGAQPKASFLAEDGSLWLAKFPSTQDRHDQGAWEYLASVLAGRAGVEMPRSRLLELGPRYRTFAAERFDRVDGSRRLYASAMTLLGHEDGDAASYVDVAEAIQLHGASERIAAELAQLYRRIVFSILIANRDDHLRNHGFLRTPTGWALSPAFDISPNPDKSNHALAIDETDSTPSLANLRAIRELYRLDEARARAIETEVRTAVRSWPELADELRIARPERERLRVLIDPERS